MMIDYNGPKLRPGNAVGMPPALAGQSRETCPRPLLKPGRNCWRIERAHRIAWLIDEQYFSAAKQAIKNARHSVLLLAWDFAAATRLEPANPDATRPDRIGDLLIELAARRPNVRIHVLVWSKATLLSLRRQKTQAVQAKEMSRAGIHYVLDNQHPPLCCQHEKVLVIDDAIAFCGGFDFVENRWDSHEHFPDDTRRQTPSGKPYPPHHDVMMAVDGPAAAGLGDLARQRWSNATGDELPSGPGTSDPWPQWLRPELRDVEVAIVRTAPEWRGRPPLQENRQLYLDAIASARKTIYLENQYFACDAICQALRRRLLEPEGPEVVVVNPKWSSSFLEEITVDSVRTRAVRLLRDADRFDRFRIYAASADSRDIAVHSKVMIIDDRIIRVGSTNLDERSMGTDTECDLAVEAVPAAANYREIRRAAGSLRNRLLADHLGREVESVEGAFAKTHSLIGTIDQLSGTSYRRLRELPTPSTGPFSGLAQLTDPPCPPRPVRAWTCALALTLVAVAIWRWRDRGPD